MTSRKTRQRQAVRDSFTAAGRPLNPAEVLALAGAQQDGIGMATIYRSIKALLEEGFLTEVELPGAITRYEIAGKDHHHHFHCRQCGKVFELEVCVADYEKLAPPGFSVTGHEVLLYGLCKDCAAAQAALLMRQ